MSNIENDIGKIDRNFEIKEKLGLDDVAFYDVTKEPFTLYGLYLDEGLPFRRMPKEVGDAVSKGVASLNFNTAGGRVRFRTDSPYIAISVKMPSIRLMSHMPLSGSAGFDLYEVHSSHYYYVKTFIPPRDATTGYESVLYTKNGGKMTEYEINFPLYNRVDSLEVGIKEGASLEKCVGYGRKGRILYYGASITQGGCASKPSNSYEGMISHKLDIDHINLGFSGNCKGEPVMAEYLATVPSDVFVLDYDGNAKDAAHLRNTHLNVYRKYREAFPDTPIVIVSLVRTTVDTVDLIKRRQIILDTYYYAIDHGDRKVSFVDGCAMFSDWDAGIHTVDGTHPNDAGFVRMAEAIGIEVERALDGYFPFK